MPVQRITIAGVPVDILREEELESAVLELLSRPGTKRIVFLSVWGLLKAQRKGDFQDCIKTADLILPVSKSIVRGALFLKKSSPVRYNPFSAVINILSILDSHLKSLYLFGAHRQTLQSAERNVRSTFPQLGIVGRSAGYYAKDYEGDIVQAIYKAAPSLVLLGDGIKEKERWAYRRQNSFSSSIFLHYEDVFGIFAKRIRRVDEKVFARGHEIFSEVLHNPAKIFLIFPFLYYLLLLFRERFFKKRKKRTPVD
ncbi:MAG: WecB/TagA/CpsF family glycosyltransferase [Treponema sp.]